MRILIKGGVWKNTEDEILKAAVMKYGKNQWSRISSLLVRKSAKQCKARWHEWLDPSIKKTEWSRDEEEKLLHLAKLMPTQWRTIAPIVGRTAAQCLEHYERLLDQATRQDQELAPGDDPRRLRPGEIDPNPEGKPARPDPVDMDEDEKEMLSEARARLANTRGKKAKRKAREKQLEESRRLAALQKRRELKAAGIELSARNGRKRGVDYNTEIPFQKVPPAGFFDTTGEDAAAEAAVNAGGEFKSVLKSKLDAPNRDAAEAKARKADAEKVKRRREENLPEQIALMNKINDPSIAVKRARLMMPPPQVTDRELDDVVKASASAAAYEQDGVDPTAMLINSYEQTPSMTTMRTPRMGGAADTVLEEAAAQAAAIAQDSSLLGGETAPQLLQGDFGGITPRQNVLQTPNAVAAATPGATPRAAPTPGATPMRGALSVAGGSVGGLTPGRSSVAASVMSATPARDALSINEDGEVDVGALPPNAQKRLLKQRKMAISSMLGQLPAPVNEYKIVMPDLAAAEEDDEEEEPMEEDALDEHEREQEAEAEALRRELAKRSQTIQRELPRPLVVNREYVTEATGELAAADKLLHDEMLKMLEADATAYPVSGAPEGVKKRKKLKQMDPERLAEAKTLLDSEVQQLQREKPLPTGASLQSAWEAASEEYDYVPSLQRFARVSSLKKNERLQVAQQQLQLLKNFMSRDGKKAAKVDKKLALTLGGYKKRASALSAKLGEQQQVVADKRMELACFQKLAGQESLALPQRERELTTLLSEQNAREAQLQTRFSELNRLRKTLLEGGT